MIPIETKQLINIINHNTDYILCKDILWLIKEFIISEYAQKYLFSTDEDELFYIPFDVINFDKMDKIENRSYDDLISCECHYPFASQKSFKNLNKHNIAIYKPYIIIKCMSCPLYQEYFIRDNDIIYDGSIKLILKIAYYGFSMTIY